MTKDLQREAILRYAQEKWGTEPEYPWAKYPNYAILRRNDNRKWYAVFLEVPKDKLGLSGKELVDILDVKLDQRLIGSLLGSRGYLPAYHMNKSSWIGLLLDGSIPPEEIAQLVELSFELTAPKKRRSFRGDSDALF